MPVYTFTTFDDPSAVAGATWAFGVNDMDQIVGSYLNATGWHGFLLSGGTYITLDDPLAAPGHTYASAINAMGQIVGYYNDARGSYHGFLFSGGTYTTLDDTSVTSDTEAAGINAMGQIVGWYNDASGYHGFLYSDGLYAALDDPAGTAGTFARGINASGQIVGNYVDALTLQNHGFLYNPDGTYITIDDPLATQGTVAYGINDVGQIVGQYQNDSGNHNFLYSGGMYTTIDDPVSGQARAYAIDNDGHIVGILLDGTGDHGFLAILQNPPPPAGTSVFLFIGKQNPDSSTTFSIYDLGNNSVLAGPYVLGDAPPQVEVEATSYLNGSTLAAMFRIDDGSGTLVYTPIVDNNSENPPIQLGAIGEPWRFEGINARGSEMVWRNAASADLEGYTISNQQIIGANHMGAVGLEWQTVTMGRFGSASDGLIMQSQSTGVLEIYDIQNNTITGASQLGTVGTDWKFSGLGNFNGDGTTDLLLRNDHTGGLQIYNIKDDKIVGTAFLGMIDTDWMYAGVGSIADDSSQNLLLRNTSGDLESYTIKNNAIVDAVMAGHTDPAQTMVVGLVQAMAGFGGGSGAAESLNTAPLGADTSQQQLLATPQHA